MTDSKSPGDDKPSATEAHTNEQETAATPTPVDCDPEKNPNAGKPTAFNNALVNGLGMVHAGSGGRLYTTDVCYTDGSKKEKKAYQNVAKTENLINVEEKFTINGNGVATADSVIEFSEGSGPGGGVNSGTVNGQARFLTVCHHFKVNGKPVVLEGSLMTSNNDNTDVQPLQQPGITPAKKIYSIPASSLQPNPNAKMYTIGTVGNKTPNTAADWVYAFPKKGRLPGTKPRDGRAHRRQ